jgi:putative PIN family toxin of toxin-antitoxin system
MDNVIIDTNVFVTALISRRGASFKLLSLINTGLFDIHLSVPLVLEYEDAAKRLVGTKIKLTEDDIDNVIDYLCSVAYHQSIFYLWRPFLTDPRDEMVLELAVNARCQYILTYNERDFRGAERFSVTPINPKTYLEQLGVL